MRKKKFCLLLACRCNPAGTSSLTNECHPQTGNCRCLNHVTGCDCSYCEVGFFNLQQGVGCERWSPRWIPSLLLNQSNHRAGKKIQQLTSFFLFSPPPSDASVIRLARHPPRVIRSQVNACAMQEWRGRCAIPVAWVSLASHHAVAEVRDLKSANFALILWSSAILIFLP